MAGSGLGGYRAVLRTPGAAAFCGAAAVVRLGQAMLGLGAVLLLVQTGQPYVVAGLVAGALAIAQGVLAPQVSRLVDEHGQRTVVAPQLLVHVVAVAALVTGAQRDWPTWGLVAAGFVAGAGLPQAGALARARWTALLSDPVGLGRALAVESLVEEAVFVVGPVLATLLATVVAPPAGVVAALALAVVGTLALLAQRRTEPRPHRGAAPTDLPTDVPTDVPADVPADGPVTGPPLRPRRRSALADGRLLPLVGSFVAVGALFGFIEVGVVALARQERAAGVAGLMLGLWAAGSLVAGTVYGARDVALGPRARFRVGAAAMALGALLVTITATTGSLPLVTAALVVAGLANAPTLITGNVLVPTMAAPRNLTEAYTWLGVAVFAGIAVGSAVGGVLIDHRGPVAALAASVLAGLLVAAGAAWTTRSPTT